MERDQQGNIAFFISQLVDVTEQKNREVKIREAEKLSTIGKLPAGIASSATSVVIGYVAGGTSTIRVGSGGIMLPNHAPLVIAEQF